MKRYDVVAELSLTPGTDGVVKAEMEYSSLHMRGIINNGCIRSIPDQKEELKIKKPFIVYLSSVHALAANAQWVLPLKDVCNIKPFDFLAYRVYKKEVFSTNIEDVLNSMQEGDALVRLYFDSQKEQIVENTIMNQEKGNIKLLLCSMAEKEKIQKKFSISSQKAQKDVNEYWENMVPTLTRSTIQSIAEEIRKVDETIIKHRDEIFSLVYKKIVGITDNPQQARYELSELKSRWTTPETQKAVISLRFASEKHRTANQIAILGRSVFDGRRDYNIFLNKWQEIGRILPDGSFTTTLPFRISDKIVKKAALDIICDFLRRMDEPIYLSPNIYLEEGTDEAVKMKIWHASNQEK